MDTFTTARLCASFSFLVYCTSADDFMPFVRFNCYSFRLRSSFVSFVSPLFVVVAVVAIILVVVVALVSFWLWPNLEPHRIQFIGRVFTTNTVANSERFLFFYFARWLCDDDDNDHDDNQDNHYDDDYLWVVFKLSATHTHSCAGDRPKEIQIQMYLQIGLATIFDRHVSLSISLSLCLTHSLTSFAGSFTLIQQLPVCLFVIIVVAAVAFYFLHFPYHKNK